MVNQSSMMVQPTAGKTSRPHEIPSQDEQSHRPFSKKSTLGQISEVMDPNAFGILIDLVTWARLWDSIYQSTEQGEMLVTWDDATIRSLMFPFIGFGNNPRLYNVVSDKVNALIGRELPLWLGNPDYRRVNSMCWCVLQSIAPSLATGFTSQQAVVKILAEGFDDS